MYKKVIYFSHGNFIPTPKSNSQTQLMWGDRSHWGGLRGNSFYFFFFFFYYFCLVFFYRYSYTDMLTSLNYTERFFISVLFFFFYNYYNDF